MAKGIYNDFRFDNDIEMNQINLKLKSLEQNTDISSLNLEGMGQESINKDKVYKKAFFKNWF